MSPIGRRVCARAARFFLLLLMLAVVALQVALQASQRTPDSAPAPSVVRVPDNDLVPGVTIDDAGKPGVEGWVKTKVGGRPVEGALVRLNSILETHTDSEGHFAFGASEVSANLGLHAGGSQSIQLAVQAGGYAGWSIQSATYYRGDVLRLYPELGKSGETSSHYVAALAGARRVGSDPSLVTFAGNASASLDSSANLSVAAASSLPATIRIYRTESQTVEVVPFRDYLKHTLPNEWIPTWSSESLKAGAMAVKTYAWYWVSRGGKQAALGADLKDNTDDQVYDPNVSYASTDAAVDATFNYVMTRGGALFQAQYCAGSYDPDPTNDCPWSGRYMTQWGSAYHADHGRTWGWMLGFYYGSPDISPTPPGAAYKGEPIPTNPPTGVQPTSPPVSAANYAVGQGATNAQLFIDAYNRNGGAARLGQPTGAVHWWLQYVSENNVLAQPLSGPGGQGNTWLVYDTLKSGINAVQRAYVLTGAIAAAYANHDPAGPEWIGAPTSDPYASGPSTGGALSQGFAHGTLSVNGSSVTFTPWPEQVSAWKAEYFIGHEPPSPQSAPSSQLAGMPTLVKEVSAPDMDWAAGAGTSKTLGVGSGDWSAQFTRQLQGDGGTYDFTVTASSGVRLWLDDMLAINGWGWTGQQSQVYSADLPSGSHTLRIQFFSADDSAHLAFTMAPHQAALAPAPQATPASIKSNAATSALSVSVKWLGRKPAPDDSWVQPLTLRLSTPGNPQVVGTYQATTDRNGVALFQGLPVGTFDVHVKAAHTLQSARANISLAAASTASVDMKAQLEGDLDNDNCVTVNDFSIVQSLLGTRKDTPGFNPDADLNGDGEVTMADVSLLRSGFDRCGDISADDDVRVMSANAAPPLSQLLAPWSNPDSLNHNLALSLLSNNSSAKVGSVVDVYAVAETGDQPIDGASFVIRYDPARLQLVDAAGNATTSVEPGLALPSVMGSWVDAKGGAVGYSAGMLQGDAPRGRVIITRLHFKVLSAAGGQAVVSFATGPSSLVQLTNGAANLLSKTNNLSLSLQP